MKGRLHPEKAHFPISMQSQTVCSSHADLLEKLVTGIIDEETYFLTVNATRKNPLQCAPYCDQVKFTKFDENSSWERTQKDTLGKPTTPEYKKKKRLQAQVFDCSVTFLKDEDFEELCTLIAKIGYSYARKNKSKQLKTTSKPIVSKQSCFATLLLSRALPLAPYFLSEVLGFALLLCSVYFCACILRLSTRVFFKVRCFIELSIERSRKPEKMQLRDRGSQLFGRKCKCLPVLILKFLFGDARSAFAKTLADKYWKMMLLVRCKARAKK